MKILQARKDQAEEISRICFESKAYWGYSTAQMNTWKPELTFNENYIEEKEVFVLLNKEEAVAFYAYYSLDQYTVMLDNLFVLPQFIGKGLGLQLMDDFMGRVRKKGFKKVILHSDPNAEIFYKKYGFNTVGKKETSIEGRYMPIMLCSV